MEGFSEARRLIEPDPSPFVSMFPYLATVIVLAAISRDRRRIRLNQPACLGKSFHAVA